MAAVQRNVYPCSCAYAAYVFQPRSDGSLHGLSPKASCENVLVLEPWKPPEAFARREMILKTSEARAGSTIFALGKQKRSGATSSGAVCDKQSLEWLGNVLEKWQSLPNSLICPNLPPVLLCFARKD